MEVLFMKDKYKYHKQNDYPGERTAEKKRVAEREAASEKIADARVAEKSRTEGLKADVRVAEKGRTEGLKADARVAEKGRTEELKADARVTRRGRMDDELMDAEIQRSTARATKANKSRMATNAIGLVIIVGLAALLLVGFSWGFVTMQQQDGEIETLNTQLYNSNSRNNQLNNQLTTSNNELDQREDTTYSRVQVRSPTSSISPVDDGMNVAVIVQTSVMFSEEMDRSTINTKTFTVKRMRKTASGEYNYFPVEGTVTYWDRKATFTSKDKYWPNKIYGDVFTATISNEVRDNEGKSLLNDYVWSFNTHEKPYNTGSVTSLRS
jgi:hypothetical protein